MNNLRPVWMKPSIILSRHLSSKAPPTSLLELKRSGSRKLSLDERKRNRRALNNIEIDSFDSFLLKSKIKYLQRRHPSCLQMNLGLHCNQACNHCHVESSPQRMEMMNKRTADRILELLSKSPTIKTIDLTGGAPELNSQFSYIVKQVYNMGIRDIIVRCNLTVLFEPEQEYLPSFYEQHGVHIVASLPCYSSKNVNLQRGSGVFDKSIEALKILNSRGYGKPDSGLVLDLVYNPIGATLPRSQSVLEKQYRKELDEQFGIKFNNLLTITNMPIKRFADFLHRNGQLEEYIELLVSNFNADAVENVMCKDIINISWDGNVFDCDFNQMLEIPISMKGSNSNFTSVFDLDSFVDIKDVDIRTDIHCFGCTAGQGSSCGGSLTNE